MIEWKNQMTTTYASQDAPIAEGKNQKITLT